MPARITREQLRTYALGYIAHGDYRKAAALLWPHLVQNEWTDLIWDRLTRHRWLCIMGHGSASKTYTAVAWHLLDWWRDPRNSALVLTSSTFASMQNRIWSDVKNLQMIANERTVAMPGHLVDSRCLIKSTEIDQKNAVQAVAGQSDDTAAKIQGIHTKRMRIIIDEADNPFSESIWTALSNLVTSGDIGGVALANPINSTSEFGRNCEPKDGWASLNPDKDFEWESATGWHVLRLDGLKSPNLKAGRDIFPFLLTNKGVSDIIQKKGVNSVDYWAYVRAWYPPESAMRVIFNYQITQKILSTVHTWLSTTTPCAACDPAASMDGDECSLVLGRFGRLLDGGRTAIEAQRWISVKRLHPELPPSQDLGDQIIAHLKDHGVDPLNFICDATLPANGLSDYIRVKWSNKIMATTFAGSATDMLISADDTQPATDRYDRFVTELWWTAREWGRHGLLAAPAAPRTLRVELEGRQYTALPRGKLKIETKEDMKGRGLPSPNKGDALCLMVHLIRSRTGFLPGTISDQGGQAQTDPLAKMREKEMSLEPTYQDDTPRHSIYDEDSSSSYS